MLVARVVNGPRLSVGGQRVSSGRCRIGSCTPFRNNPFWIIIALAYAAGPTEGQTPRCRLPQWQRPPMRLPLLRFDWLVEVAVCAAFAGVALWVAAGVLPARRDDNARKCAVARKYARSASDSGAVELRCGPFLPEGMNPLRFYADSARRAIAVPWRKADKARKCSIAQRYARSARDSADAEARCGPFSTTPTAIEARNEGRARGSPR